MPRTKPISLWIPVLPIAFVGSVRSVEAASEGGFIAEISHLKSDPVIITLLASVIVLIFSILILSRKMRRELKQKGAALDKSEQQFRHMGDNLPNVTVFQVAYSEQESFTFSYLSKGYDRTLGFDRDRVLADAQLAYDHVYEEDLPVLLKAFEESRNNLTPANFELRALDNSGKLKWLNISAVPHMDQEKLVWDGFLQDITAHKNLESSLVEENRNFQNLFETIDDFLLIFDMDGKLLHVNPTVEIRLEYTYDELENMSIFQLYSADTQPEVYQVVARMQTEESTTCGIPLQKKTGGSIPVEMNVFQGFWKNRKAIFGVARDIAIRQQTESALRESQQMLQLIMDTIPMSVFWKDKDSIYLGCNKTFVRECGLNAYEDVVGKTPYDLYSPDLAPDIVERDQEVVQNNQPLLQFTQSHTRTDGSIGWREISKIPLRDENGLAVGILGVWRDITEQNHAEERLKRTLEDMERFNQLMRGRERRTLELKAEINDLLKQLGRSRKYRTTTDELQ